jgi:hypothetical protein
MKRRRGPGARFKLALPQLHGIGLQSLAELPHRNRSPLARWWRTQPGLARWVYGAGLALVGLGIGSVALLLLGGALIH